MLFNTLHRTYPCLVHAPGKLVESPWWEIIKEQVFATQRAYDLDDSLDIITWNSGAPDSILRVRGHTLGWFEKSLTHAGVRHTVLGTEVGAAWTNRMKLDLTIEFLTRSSAAFVLGGDSSDVLLIGDPRVALEHFVRQDAQMLFNAEKNFWPPELRRLRRFEDRVGEKPFGYFNSGLWIGTRQTCLEAFRVAKQWSDRLKSRPTSDQMCWKYAYRDLYPAIKADYGCEIFQNLNRVIDEIEVNGAGLPDGVPTQEVEADSLLRRMVRYVTGPARRRSAEG